MQHLTSQGLAFLAFENMALQPRLSHGVSLSRQSDPHNEFLSSRFDLSPKNPQQYTINLDRFCRAMDISSSRVVRARQVHGAAVAVVREPVGLLPDVDGLCSDVPGIALLLLGADCPLVMAYDPVRLAVGVAHAGWRGSVQQISIRLIETMAKHLRCDPRRMLAGIGPGICDKCFEVGKDVVESAHRHLVHAERVITPIETTHKSPGNKKWRFDLQLSNRLQLMEAGLASGNIENSDLCTYENTDQLFSFRRQGSVSGRHGLLACCK